MRNALAIALFSLALPLAAIQPAEAQSAMDAAQKSAIEGVVKDYLMEHPEVIVESIREMQKREAAAEEEQKAAAVSRLRPELEASPNSPAFGNPKGDITIVEFFDYQCGYCKRVFPTIVDLMKEDGNIRFVLKEFPILGEASVVGAQAALAVWNTDKTKYQDYHAQLMELKGALTEEKALAIATDLGMDAAKIKAAMDAPEVRAEIENNHDLAEQLGVRGTPAFLIAGELVPGAAGRETFDAIIKDARAKAK